MEECIFHEFLRNSFRRGYLQENASTAELLGSVESPITPGKWRWRKLVRTLLAHICFLRSIILTGQELCPWSFLKINRKQWQMHKTTNLIQCCFGLGFEQNYFHSMNPMQITGTHSWSQHRFTDSSSTVCTPSDESKNWSRKEVDVNSRRNEFCLAWGWRVSSDCL